MNSRSKIQRILVVEDNLDEARLILRCLSETCLGRAEAYLVRDGVEAIEYVFEENQAAREVREMPSLILLDLKLPRVSGLEVLERLKGHPVTRRIPVIVMSSSLAIEDVNRSLDAGANSYVCKPVEFESLRAFVSSAVEYWTNWNVSS